MMLHVVMFCTGFISLTVKIEQCPPCDISFFKPSTCLSHVFRAFAGTRITRTLNVKDSSTCTVNAKKKRQQPSATARQLISTTRPLLLVSSQGLYGIIGIYRENDNAMKLSAWPRGTRGSLFAAYLLPHFPACSVV